MYFFTAACFAVTMHPRRCRTHRFRDRQQNQGRATLARGREINGPVAIELRERAGNLRRWAVVCLVALATLLVATAGYIVAAPYLASSLAFSEQQQQADFIAKKRAALDAERKKLKNAGDALARLRREIADLALASIKPQLTRIGQFDGDVALRQISFADATHGWAVGDKGTILASSDGGATWQARPSGTENSLNGVHFADASRGWAVGYNGTILATSDGGATWQARPSGTENVLTGVHFADATHGWAVGDNGTILASSDGGATWQARPSGTANFLYGVHFADATHGWAVGDKGTILATGDGGATWQARPSGTANFLYGVHFADATHGWAVGRRGTILATSDGGATWQARPSGTTNFLYGVHFADATHGWAVGDNGTILATSDGGATWQARPSGTENALYGVHFADATHGWAVGYNGTILASSDGGATWQARPSGTTNFLYGVHFADASRGWAVGGNGTILRWNLPETAKLLAADTPEGMRAALHEFGVGTDAIGRPLQDFDRQVGEIADLKARIALDEQEPAPAKPAGDKPASESPFKDLLTQSSVSRIFVSIYTFFAMAFLGTIYRYATRLSAHYDACAFALNLSDGELGDEYHRLVRTLSPAGIDFGKMPATPIDRLADILRDGLQAARKSAAKE
jgi:photosystem II stability/assembly factor-like uncharacterized protein